MKKIKVQIGTNISNKMHTLFHSFLNNPPEGVEYQKTSFKVINEKNYSLFGKAYKKITKTFPFLKKFHQDFNDLLRKDEGSDIVHFIFVFGKTKKNFVLEYENSYSFVRIDQKNKPRLKKRVIKQLSKNNVKFLIAIHKEALKSFKLFFGNSVKVPQEILYPTIFIPEENRPKVKKKNKVIFISTSNNLEDKAFLIKGGSETLIAFEELAKKYPKWEFIILGKVPRYLEKEFPKNLILKEGVPREKMWELFNESKIFVQPCYQAPAMAFLEAMWFKLPIITYNCWGNPEYIDKENGIILDPKKINYIDEYNVPVYSEKVLDSIRKNSKENSKKILISVEKLIRNEKLRKKLGENGFDKVLNGKFSIEKRNEKLRKIYKEALSS